jgi:preprotein translocase subunit SecG
LLTYTLYGLFILSCIVLVVAVLLQPGKADAGALFSSSVSSTAFGPRGTQTLLAKITIAAAALFMLCALALSLPAIIGTRSVLQSQPDNAPPQTTPTPAAPANTNTASQSVPVQPEAAPQSNANAAVNTTTAPANANTTTKAPAASNTANSKPNQKPPQKKK